MKLTPRRIEELKLRCTAMILLAIIYLLAHLIFNDDLVPLFSETRGLNVQSLDASAWVLPSVEP